MPLNIVPESHATEKVTVIPQGLEYSAPAAQSLNGAHPLEARVANWDATQRELRMEMYRRAYGAAEPIRRSMELEIMNRGSLMGHLGGTSDIHRDILLNNDATLTWEDVHADEASDDVPAMLRSRMGL